MAATPPPPLFHYDGGGGVYEMYCSHPSRLVMFIACFSQSCNQSHGIRLRLTRKTNLGQKALKWSALLLTIHKPAVFQEISSGDLIGSVQSEPAPTPTSEPGLSSAGLRASQQRRRLLLKLCFHSGRPKETRACLLGQMSARLFTSHVLWMTHL